MSRVVVVHGFSEEPIRINVALNTALEVIELVARQVPELATDLINGPKRIQVVGYRTIEELLAPIRDEDTELHIVPDFTGNKGGLGQILLGAVLVAVSFIAAPMLGAWAASFLLKVGALLILGGIAQLLNPTPTMDNDSDGTKSRYLGAPKNTTASGTRIAILCGFHRVGGHILSYDINARSVRPSTDTP